VYVNRVAGELSTNHRILFRGNELCYPSPTEHLKRRMAQAYFLQGGRIDRLRTSVYQRGVRLVSDGNSHASW
jgi:hypothetical protein